MAVTGSRPTSCTCDEECGDPIDKYCNVDDKCKIDNETVSCYVKETAFCSDKEQLNETVDEQKRWISKEACKGPGNIDCS